VTQDADEVVGCTVLIGLTNYSADGAVLDKKQMFGEIKSVTEKGVEIALSDGSQFYLPPDLAALRPAPPGEYRLRETGKVVQDPDYLCIYDVTQPQKY
jgi:hypothetical protein